MNEQERYIQSLKIHLDESLAHIQNGNGLTEGECTEVIEDLEAIKSLPKITEEVKPDTEVTIVGMSVDEMISEFNESADGSKKLLQEMLSVITDGRVPEKSDIDELDHSIQKLQTSYSSITKYVSEHILPEELPADGSPIFEYTSALENSKTIQYQKQLDEIRLTLESFIAVRSLIDAYSSALQPYQKKAEELLNRITGSEVIDIEAASSENAGPVAFMRALACEDVDSQENIEIFENVLEFFPPRVQMGLLTKKYYVDTDAERGEGTGNSKTIQPGQSVLSAKAEQETDEITSTVVRTGEDAGIVSNIKPTEEETVLVQQESSEKEEGKTSGESVVDDEPAVSSFVQALIKNNAFISPEENIGFLHKEISPAEDKKLSSKSFLNDVRERNQTAAKKILEIVSKTNCITPEFIATKGVPKSIAESVLADLHKKGCLRKYELSPYGCFYCASPRLMKALGFKEVSKFAGIRQRTMDDWGTDIADKETSAATRLAYIKLWAEARDGFLSDHSIIKYSENDMTFTDAFCFRIFNSEVAKQCVFVTGAFWDNTNECDDDYQHITELLDDCEGITCFVIAGYDLARAKAIADTLLSESSYDFSSTKIYLYSFKDREYYSYDSQDLMEAEDVFKSDAVEAEEAIEEVIANEPDDMNGQNNAGPVRGEVDTTSQQKEEKRQEALTKEEEHTDIEQREVHKKQAVAPIVDTKQVKKKEKQTESAKADVKETIYRLLSDQKFYAAAAYAKASVGSEEENQKLYDLISFALNDPMAHCSYSSENAFNLISERGMFNDAMVVSVALRTFFSNQIQFDYQIKPFYDGIKEYPILHQIPALSNILYSLMEFKDGQKKGMDAYAGYRAKNQAQLEQGINKVQHDAADFYESFVVGRKKENASQKRFLETKKLMFSISSDFGIYLKAAADGERDWLSAVEDFLQKEFLKDGETISEESISADKLWSYIVRFWDQAGETMMYKLHADLTSSLRSNITNQTQKAVQILIRWCVLLEQASIHAEDEGTLAYRRKRSPILADIAKATEEIDSLIGEEISEDEHASLCVLKNTLDEISRCLDGSFDESERKYFYAPFLLTDDVLLDESFIPDLDIRSAELESVRPAYRIMEHVHKVKPEMDYAARLREILEEQGDDYGSASLIVEYLSDINLGEDFTDQKVAIEKGVSYARESAEIRKNDFIGELELAQSYGQIDNSVEDKKEKILQIIDEWYEWAVDSSNYGFFRKIMEIYLSEIRKEAKSREADLLEQLESFRATQVTGLTTEAKERRAARIEAMIREQNYTVAEDLLARAVVADDDHEDVMEEDFLKDFLDNYDDYYKRVATHKSNFSSLVSSHTRNKEERGAKRLADNWLPGGSRLGRDRLSNLLSCLGFRVGSIKDQSTGGRFESYIVMTAAAADGQRDNYTHPIAAFGSMASQEGFRIVCVNGGYDADGLIDLMKQIGNSKHTLILHDYALALSERRRLARKARNELGDKFFGVIDRTVMMFLVRNYDETKINRMLISLIMPFGYYQPYVWESVNVMPPEIFMGRKQELERIKSPTGVNIVYGGRQLGKSALLKKAKEDVDWNENGDRAVYIDLKGLNYEEAANKIGHELYDQYILPEDIDTTDWSELSRVIRRRLQDQKKKIPYLLLLLDEADAFIESCEIVNYKPLDALKDIQNIGANRFKFVVAGLRNIVRFKREIALGNNSVLTHLESMTVKPFKTTEARELMEIPLHYLGLQFPKEKESLITLILASTNYFPGLIQMYCAKLLEAMRNKDYAGYNEVNTPIYEISEAHIKKVLADPEFMQQIREKFIITLRLDEDNYYYLIALIMAYLYHRNGYSEGYSAEDIHKEGSDLYINKISDLDIGKLSAFMEELRELNVLRSTDDTHYLFTRFTFFQMMGTSSEVEDKLADYMEG